MTKKTDKKIVAAKSKTKKSATELPVENKPKEYNFFADVYDVVRQIPKGRVTSYGAIAAYLGTRLSARMVGWAMNAAGTAKPKVPAQRVVNRLGILSGKHHFGDADAMENMLKKDGVSVKDDKVVDFEKIYWDPVKELIL